MGSDAPEPLRFTSIRASVEISRCFGQYRGTQRRFPPIYMNKNCQAIQSNFRSVELHSICGAIKFVRGTQREYSAKPLKHSIVKRILVLVDIGIFLSPKNFSSVRISQLKVQGSEHFRDQTYLFETFSQKKGSRKSVQVTF